MIYFKLSMARHEQKPGLVKGDLRTDLAALAQEAPKNATLVIFHTVVNSLINTAVSDSAGSSSSRCNSVVLPEPRKPVADLPGE